MGKPLQFRPSDEVREKYDAMHDMYPGTNIYHLERLLDAFHALPDDIKTALMMKDPKAREVALKALAAVKVGRKR